VPVSVTRIVNFESEFSASNESRESRGEQGQDNLYLRITFIYLK
jgi:hypothetical protein